MIKVIDGFKKLKNLMLTKQLWYFWNRYKNECTAYVNVLVN